MHLFININSTGFRHVDNSDLKNVHENGSVSFRFETDEPSRYSVVIGDYELTLNQVTDKGFPLTYESGVSQCFRNFIGICPIHVVDESANIVKDGTAINVFGSKATYNRALSFLRFIIKHNDFSSACFSVSRAGSDGVHNKNNISAKIEAGNKTLSHLRNEWVRFKRDPIAKINVKNKIRAYAEGEEVGPDGISYIISHPDSLQPTHAENSGIQIKGTHYAFTSTSAITSEKDKNVPENQHILMFLADFHSYLTNLEKSLNNNGSLDRLTINGVDYISIDQILQDSGMFLNFHVENIRAGIKQSFALIRQFEHDLGVKLNRAQRTSSTLTQKALVKSHYFIAYKLIDQYMKTGEPNWEGESDLYGLRNMPKLYEFVVLLRLIESLKNRDFELKEANYVSDYGGNSLQRPVNEPNNHYVMTKGTERVELFYDLHVRQMKMLNINDRIGIPVDLKHSSKRTWRPDYCIIHSDAGRSPHVHILDAKYSDEITTLKVRLPDCTFKYTSCMKVLGFENGKATLKHADSMILLHSQRDTPLQLLSDPVKESVPYFLSIDSLAPNIGVIGVTEDSNNSTEQLLDRLLIL